METLKFMQTWFTLLTDIVMIMDDRIKGRLYLVITPTVSPMLGVCRDQIVSFYLTHK